MSYEISKAARKVISDESLLSKIEEFTDDEITQLCDYCKAVHTTSDFDEEVERELKSWGPRSSAAKQTSVQKSGNWLNV